MGISSAGGGGNTVRNMMVDDKYGNRRNRHKTRMRYVFYKYGTEEAKRLYLEEFEELKKDGSIDFKAPTLPLEHHKPDFPAAAFGGRADIISPSATQMRFSTMY